MPHRDATQFSEMSFEMVSAIEDGVLVMFDTLLDGNAQSRRI